MRLFIAILLSEGVRDGLCEAMRNLRPCFRNGSFHRKNGDIYWAGIERSDALLRLQDELDTALAQRGFPVERREFRPHLTLVRRAILCSGGPDTFSMPIFEMNVEKISLMCSLPRDTGRIHTELSAKELK